MVTVAGRASAGCPSATRSAARRSSDATSRPWLRLSAALVLATSAEGGSGPLVTHFAGHAGHLPCPLYLVPGGLSREDIDRLA